MLQRELSPAEGASISKLDAEFSPELLQAQRELEDNSYAEGGRRFRHRLQRAVEKGQGSTVGAGLKLLKEGLEPLEAAIGWWVDESKRTRGPKHCALKWVEAVGTDTVAYLVLKRTLDGFSRENALRTAAIEISQLMLDELRFRRLEDEAPGLFLYLKKRQRSQHYHQVKHVYEGALKLAEVKVSDLAMSDAHKILCGIKLIDLLIESTGLVETYSVRLSRGRSRQQGWKTNVYLRMTPETKVWLDERNDLLEFRQPVPLPMVVPPLDWRADEPGGYRFKLRGKYEMVRGMHGPKLAAFQATPMPIVYHALNTIQKTPWRINTGVLTLVEQIQRRGGDLCGIPCYEETVIPEKPADIATNADSRKAWRKIAAQAHDLNHDRGVKRRDVSSVTASAEAVRNAERIYFPYSLDFRGRIYPVAMHLSPQGDDLSRALLTFADGKPLGSDGAAWLAVHLANLLDITPEGEKVSRMTLEDRCSWVQRNTVRIQQVAADPFADTWWTEAESPLQFYAACCEWDGFAKAFAKGEGDSYVSHLPIAMDGSCNGLQHFSAMFRDVQGGSAVNLVPMDIPQDVYQRVADSVNEQLVPLASQNPLAAQLLASGLVTRKLCKRPTMTFGYGSKKFGFREQLVEYMKGLENWNELNDLFSDADGKPQVLQVCGLLSELIMQALHDTVVAAFDGMAWMQQCARLIVDAGKAVEWIVPATGFPVAQPYYESMKKQVKTVLSGSIIQPAVYTTTDKIQRHRQRNAIAPNVVHSLDAAALMLCVTEASTKHGIEAYGMVHDSYATLAADTATMAQCIRQTFYQLYTNNDVVGSLAEQFRAQCKDPSEMQNPPAMGDLDLAQVFGSTYFFS